MELAQAERLRSRGAGQFEGRVGERPLGRGPCLGQDAAVVQERH